MRWSPREATTLGLVVIVLTVWSGFDLPLCAGQDEPAAPGDRLSGDIADARSTVPRIRYNALDRLGKYKEPHAVRQAEVAALCLEYMNGRDIFAAKYAGLAMIVWATPKEVEQMPKFLGHARLTESAIRVLGRFRVVGQAAAVAAYLERQGDTRRAASEALIQMGPPAEMEVVRQLTHRSTLVQKEAVHILKLIGTRKSLVSLESVANRGKKHAAVAQEARLAIDAIRAREADESKPDGRGAAAASAVGGRERGRSGAGSGKGGAEKGPEERKNGAEKVSATENPH
jgi:hypothetical protein